MKCKQSSSPPAVAKLFLVRPRGNPVTTSRSPEETREHYISYMGKPLGEASYALWSEVALLFRDWGEFTYIFGSHPNRTELLINAALVYFRSVLDALFVAMVIRIDRLSDQ